MDLVAACSFDASPLVPDTEALSTLAAACREHVATSLNEKQAVPTLCCVLHMAVKSSGRRQAAFVCCLPCQSPFLLPELFTAVGKGSGTSEGHYTDKNSSVDG